MGLHKIGRWILICTFIWWFIYTAYFGFNWEAINETEKLFDEITDALLSLGIVFWLSPLIDMWNKKVEDFYNETSNRI